MPPSRMTRLSSTPPAASYRSRVSEDRERPVDIDDPELLARQARELVEKQAAEIRSKRVPIDIEPPTVYSPRRTPRARGELGYGP